MVVSEVPNTLAGKKIMLVEDDAFLGDLVTQKFLMSGILMTRAVSGEEALAFIEKDVPDLILLDLILPGMSGFDVLAQIKSNEAHKHVPVIVFSNLGQKEDIEKAKALGAVKFLVKVTMAPSEIIGEISKILN